MSERLCTVIVPYYNTDRAVFDRCMQSLGHVPPDVLVLIVDDGSDEAHSHIPLAYQKENIRVLRQENRGVSAARNTGLANAQGSYVCFLDSDDRAGEGFPLSFCRTARELDTEVLFSEVSMDVLQMTGNDHTEQTADPLELAEIKRRWQPFLERLPEYQTVCEKVHKRASRKDQL